MRQIGHEQTHTNNRSSLVDDQESQRVGRVQLINGEHVVDHGTLMRPKGAPEAEKRQRCARNALPTWPSWRWLISTSRNEKDARGMAQWDDVAAHRWTLVRRQIGKLRERESQGST